MDTSLDLSPLFDALATGDYTTAVAVGVLLLLVFGLRAVSGKWPLASRIADFLARLRLEKAPAKQEQAPAEPKPEPTSGIAGVKTDE